MTITRMLRDNGLSIVAFGLFFLTTAALAPVGWLENNQELASHHQLQMTFWAYLGSGHWWEALFENWESEFLQMGVFVWLSAELYQRGSAESNDPEDPMEPERKEAEAYARARKPGPVAWLKEGEDSGAAVGAAGGGGGGPSGLGGHALTAPWPVRQGGWIATLYAHSLSIALVALFSLSFLGHAWSGARLYSAEQITHGEAPIGMWAYMGTVEFWFESLQNWQSEFLAVAVLTVFSIFLRERYSAQSKAVAAPHEQTGSD